MCRLFEKLLTGALALFRAALGLNHSVPKLATLMLEGHLHPVLITENESVVGIVTSSDVLRLWVDGA